MTHRFSQNFTLLSNYTWSHCLSLSDFTGELTGPSFESPASPGLDYGNCGMNLDQNFNASLVASSPKFQGTWTNRLLGNWQISPIITAHSGLWFYATLGSTDNSRTGVEADRPIETGSPYHFVYNTPNSTASTRYVQILNPAAFSEAPVGSLGDEGRNSLEGPGFFNVDAALIRYFPRQGADEV